MNVKLGARDGKIDTMELRLREYVHDTETAIAGEFYKWARTAEARLRSGKSSASGLIEPFGALEARVLDVEQRLRGKG